MITMHLVPADAGREELLCKGEVSVHELIDLEEHLDRRMHDLPVPTVCERCKVLTVPWAANYCRELEADAKNFRAKAERLRERDPVCYRSSSEEADLEADQLEDKATEYRRLVDRLARETGLKRSGNYEARSSMYGRLLAFNRLWLARRAGVLSKGGYNRSPRLGRNPDSQAPTHWGRPRSLM